MQNHLELSVNVKQIGEIMKNLLKRLSASLLVFSASYAGGASNDAQIKAIIVCHQPNHPLVFISMEECILDMMIQTANDTQRLDDGGR